MGKLIKISAVLIIFLALLGLGIKIIKDRKEKIANDVKPFKPQVVLNGVEVKYGSLEIYRNFSGTVIPVDTVNVGTKIVGYIKKLYVSEGQKVKKGSLILKIDDKEIKENIKSLKEELKYLNKQLEILKLKKLTLESNLKFYKNKFKRDKTLYENNALPEEAFEQSKLMYVKAEVDYKVLKKEISGLSGKIKSLEHKISSQENLLKYTEIRSSVDGVVGRVFLKEGSLSVAGKPILEIYTGKKIVVNIPLSVFNKIKVGTKAVISINGNILNGEIVKKYPFADRDVPVAEVKIDNIKDIPVNKTVNVEILTDKFKGFIIPEDSLLNLSDGIYVLTEKDGIIEKIPVNILSLYRGKAVVKGNLREGMIIAVGTQSSLRKSLMMGKGKIIIEGNR
ncbi:efflux RND transporter periplasmic adaptor subunit [Persephonella sp.]